MARLTVKTDAREYQVGFSKIIDVCISDNIMRIAYFDPNGNKKNVNDRLIAISKLELLVDTNSYSEKTFRMVVKLLRDYNKFRLGKLKG